MDNNQLNSDLFPEPWERINDKIDIVVKTSVNFSESKEKVLQSIKNIFPEFKIEEKEVRLLVGNSSNISDLFYFFKMIFNQKILDVARKCALELKERKVENQIILYLNKQTAFINKVNFSTLNDAPMGPIELNIKYNDIDYIVNRYFPKYEWFAKSKEKEKN